MLEIISQIFLMFLVSVHGTFTDYIGLDIYTKYQSNTPTIQQIRDIFSRLNINHFLIHINDDNGLLIANEIIQMNSNVTFMIQVPLTYIDPLSKEQIITFLNQYKSITNYMTYILIYHDTFDTINDMMLFSQLPYKLRLMYDTIQSLNEYNHIKVSTSFTNKILVSRYPPLMDSYFIEPMQTNMSRSQPNGIMYQILTILDQNNASFGIQIHPYFKAQQNPDLLSYCLGEETQDFNGQILYGYMDQEYINIENAIKNLIGNKLNIIVTSTGWSTYNNNIHNSPKYLYNLITKITQYPFSKIYHQKIYISEAFDQDLLTNSHRKHFGLYDINGAFKFGNESALNLQRTTPLPVTPPEIITIHEQIMHSRRERNKRKNTRYLIFLGIYGAIFLVIYVIVKTLKCRLLPDVDYL